eukprot:1157935-Pelagomonas_calceolata.AAC.12
MLGNSWDAYGASLTLSIPERFEALRNEDCTQAGLRHDLLVVWLITMHAHRRLESLICGKATKTSESFCRAEQLPLKMGTFFTSSKHMYPITLDTQACLQNVMLPIALELIGPIF